MSRIRAHAPILLACVAGLLAAAAAAGHDGAHAPAAKPTSTAAKPVEAKATPQGNAAYDAMMEQMMKFAVPGAGHEKLKDFVGKWKAVTKWWTGPGEPTVSEGMSENQLVLGGRYLQQSFKGNMMNQPFEGWGLTGYDNMKAEYNFLWVDNMSTFMMTGAGTMDASGKELTTKSVAPGPDGKPQEVRMVTKLVDDKTHVWSMYGMMGDQEMLMMEITYTRL